MTELQTTLDPELLQQPLRVQQAEKELIRLCRRAVTHLDEKKIIDELKTGMIQMARERTLGEIEYPAPRPDRYARGLCYADPWNRFSVIAMTWNTGHRTPLHDHAGVWCVEVVVDGEMQVVNYELMEEDAKGRCRFERRETITAPAASSGALLPPFEHHVFSNVGNAPSHTLHVYRGPMSRCDIFEPGASDRPTGYWQRVHRALRYDN